MLKLLIWPYVTLVELALLPEIVTYVVIRDTVRNFRHALRG
jgi:hypothetical protein